MTGERVPFGPGPIVLGAAALFLTTLLLIGVLLPTDWEAEASTWIAAPPGAVFTYLDSPEGWQAWTPWPDSSLVREGPERGAGASIRWSDREVGTGSFRLVDVRADAAVSYEVEVSGGAMRTSGRITLDAEGDGVRVTWREEGVLGGNPLMGYWAFFMERAQTSELDKGLTRLGELVTGVSPQGERPDSSSTPEASGPGGAGGPGSDRVPGEGAGPTGSATAG